MQSRAQEEKIGQKFFFFDRLSKRSLLRPFFLLGCVSSTLIACQSVPTETRSPALVNGQVTELAKNSGLVLQIIEGEKQSRCSASFVNLGLRNVIVTAAHCLWAVDQKKATANVYRVQTRDEDDYLEKIGSIVSQKIHENYRAQNRNIEDPYDLALGLLDKEVSADMTPLNLPNETWLPEKVNSEVMYLMGAGFTVLEYALDKSPAMIRTARIEGEYSVRRGSLFGSLLDMVASSGFKPGDTLRIRKPQEEGPYLCPGDSGGAMVVAEEQSHTLVGVVSTEQLIVYQGRKVCWYPVNLIPLSAHLKWLKDSTQELVRTGARKK